MLSCNLLHYRRAANVYEITRHVDSWNLFSSINVAVPEGADDLDDTRLPETVNVHRGLVNDLSGRYLVARRSGADMHVFVDDDFLIDKSWVERAVVLLRSAPDHLICGRGRIPLAIGPLLIYRSKTYFEQNPVPPSGIPFGIPPFCTTRAVIDRYFSTQNQKLRRFSERWMNCEDLLLGCVADGIIVLSAYDHGLRELDGTGALAGRISHSIIRTVFLNFPSVARIIRRRMHSTG